MAGSKSLLTPMSPAQQLRAGRLPRRLTQLMVGLSLFGASVVMVIRSGLGQPPWDVFHVGVSARTGLSLGTVIVLVGVVVLLSWIPLREIPGLGTVLNTVWIGVAADVAMRVIQTPDHILGRVGLLLAGVVGNALAASLYIGTQLGPGPRDGLMTGLHRKTGISLRVIRTVIEVAALVIGWILGGLVGIGTLVYALAIGPLIQLSLPYCIIPAERPVTGDAGAEPPQPGEGN